MAYELPYTSKPEDITRLVRVLQDSGVPTGPLDAAYFKSKGFTASSAKYLIDILKKLGFIDENDQPLPAMIQYIQSEERGSVLASAVGRTYADLFEQIFCPYLADDESLLGFFKDRTGASAKDLELMLRTFRNLVEPADFQDMLCLEEPDLLPESNKAPDNLPAVGVGGIDVALLRDHDHLDVGVFLLHPFEDIQARHIRQPVIQRDDVRHFMQVVKHAPAVKKIEHLVIGVQTERMHEQAVVPVVIFNHKYFERSFLHQHLRGFSGYAKIRLLMRDKN